MVAITVASHYRLVSIPSNHLFPIDKWAHLSVFGLLSTSLIRSVSIYGKQCSYLKPLMYAIFTTALFGFFDEVHQSFHPARVFSVADWLADFLGAFIAAIAYTYLPFYRNFLERPIYSKSRLPSAPPPSQISSC